MCDVSIIIVNYHVVHLIADCIDSIIRHTKGISYEIIVVDNNSQPEMKEFLYQRLDNKTPESLKVVNLPENIGFGRANNEGFKIAQGDKIFFLNPDTILLNNAVKILSDFLDNHKEVGACGGNIYDQFGQPTFSFWRVFPGLYYDLDALFKYIPTKLIYGPNLHHNFTRKPCEVAYIIGADLMTRRHILKETGGFSPEFFMFFEESDLCRRIRRLGYKIFSVPEAKIIHLESKTFEKNSFPGEKRVILSENSRNIYLQRNFGKAARLLSNSVYWFFLKTRVLLLQDKNKKEYFRLRLKHFRFK